MITLYALRNPKTRELYTHLGRVIVHENRAEMEWLFPKNEVAELSLKPGEDVMFLQDLPSMAPVTFPLKKSDFR